MKSKYCNAIKPNKINFEQNVRELTEKKQL